MTRRKKRRVNCTGRETVAEKKRSARRARRAKMRRMRAIRVGR